MTEEQLRLIIAAIWLAGYRRFGENCEKQALGYADRFLENARLILAQPKEGKP